MELWVPITIAAAFCQNLRFMLQKQLRGQLSTLGATFARFVFAAPLAILLISVLVKGGDPLPMPTPRFLSFALVGGVAQIVATALLVALFGLQNFAVGVTYSKTETVMTAILSAVILVEPVGMGALVAVMVTVVGVILMSRPPGAARLLEGLTSRAALIGIGSGVIFAVSSICYRGATLALEAGDALMRGAFTLACVTMLQTLLMGGWMMMRQPGQVRQVFLAWRIAIWVGITGMLGSLGWFTAFALVNATYVKALGQIEIVFTVIASVLFFRERLRRIEFVGIALIVAGILLLLAIG